MRPTFTILIGSAGRPTLVDTLASIAGQQTIAGDQVFVGFDANGKTPAQLEDLFAGVYRYNEISVCDFIPYAHIGIADSVKVVHGATVRPGQPYSWLGVEQINYALKTMPISGSHVLTLGDDDVFLPGAFDVIRDVCATDQSRPVLWQFLAPWRERLWDRPRLKSCRISGCCIAAPKQYVGLHPTTIEATHDYRWIVEIVAAAKAQQRPPIWIEYLAVVARPQRGEQYERGSGQIVAEVPA